MYLCFIITFLEFVKLITFNTNYFNSLFTYGMYLWDVICLYLAGPKLFVDEILASVNRRFALQ